MIQKIELAKLTPNVGQIDGLPANPRQLSDTKLEKLKKSLQDDPEMLDLRELLVFLYGEKYVVIAGNMRYRAALELGIKSLPCKIIPPQTPVSKLKAYTIKDNSTYGDWDYDMLANEWDEEELSDWGVDVWVTGDTHNGDGNLPEELHDIDLTPNETAKLSGDGEVKYDRIIIVYPPNKKDALENIIGIPITKIVFNINELRNE